MNKLIFVSGGVCSSLGKGVAASSLGALLESRGFNVRMVKCDPYINVNAGNQSPHVHGEIYVTDDGAQTDLDLGNYARFTSGPLSQANSITTGQVYDSVIRKEREGGYKGLCVQVIPHITDEIKARVMAVVNEAADTDIVIVEIGGTVGDIESVPFLEAARQLIHESGRNNAISVHLTLIPEVGGGELKTKPTQHSVKAMQEMGIQPDVLLCRAPVMLDEATCHKIALFTNVEKDAVFTACNVDNTIYEIPLTFHEQKLDQVVLKKLGIEARHANIAPWKTVMEQVASRKGKVRIGIVGEYTEFQDAYKSVYEALFHAGLECGLEVEPVNIDPARLKDPEFANSLLGDGIDGILIPGGFGSQAVEGMIQAAAWARKNKAPYFGICQGMHIMVIEWGRNVLGWKDADSTEFNKDAGHPVISCLAAHGAEEACNMRLGKYVSVAQPGSKIFAAYGEETFSERHRHRHEFSNQYRDEMVKSGLIIGALYPQRDLVECVEWPGAGQHSHPWGLGVQFHPEFKSKPTAASPLFRDFIAACRDLRAAK